MSKGEAVKVRDTMGHFGFGFDVARGRVRIWFAKWIVVWGGE